MYQVLYRKWRPKTFSDVSGQDHITITLKNAIKSGRLSHAYLFTGSRGTGKTSCAKILAKAVNCLHPVDGDPCNQCEICKGIDDGTILDVEEIDAASNNGVDNIRALREEVYFTPTAGKYRVYIIDEVHMLSVPAFNALLKTLEEPPEHVIFVLATTEVHKVPVTVLSRCQRFDFGRIADSAIAARLHFVAKQEQFSLTNDAAELIARLADGGMRDALSILDRCAGTDVVDVERINQIVGLPGNDRLHTLATAVATGDIATCLANLEELHRNAGDMTRLCDQMITYFRNVMLAKAVPNPANLMVCSAEDLRGFMNAAHQFSMERILQVLQVLQEAREHMAGAVNQRVELEMAMIRLTLPTSQTVAPTPQPIEIQTPTLVPPAPNPQPQAKPAPSPKEEIPAIFRADPAAEVDLPWKEGDGEQIRKNEDAAARYRQEVVPPFTDDDCPPEEPMADFMATTSEEVSQPATVSAVAENGLPYFAPWAQVIETLAQKHRMMASVLMGSEAFLQDDIVLIKANNPQFLDLIRMPQNRNAVRDAIVTVTGKTYRLGPYKEQANTPQQDPLQAFLQGLQGKVAVEDLDKTQQ